MGKFGGVDGVVWTPNTELFENADVKWPCDLCHSPLSDNLILLLFFSVIEFDCFFGVKSLFVRLRLSTRMDIFLAQIVCFPQTLPKREGGNRECR